MTDPAPVEDTLADRIATAVRSVPGVADLHAGSFGEVATYLAGRRITGVRNKDEVTEVHVVATMGTPLPALADAVADAVQPLVADTTVQVYVEDVVPQADRS